MPQTLNPQTTACLVIDMQNGFVHPESAMGRAIGTSAQQAIIPVIKKVLEICRECGIPVVWTQQEHFPSDVTREQRAFLPHSQKQGFLPCLRGSWEVDFEESLHAVMHSEDHIVTKHRASAFYNTNLETKLRMLGVRLLIIVGCNTEFCVESTVRDAYARDYDLIVISDAVAGMNQEFHRICLLKFQALFAEVIAADRLPMLVSHR